MSFSLASEQCAGMSIDSVTRPGLLPMRKVMEELGYDTALHHVTKLLIDADLALGGDGDFHRCQTSAATVMINSGHRSFGFIALAVREGLANTSSGKAYGKLNTQLVNDWLSVLTGKVIAMAEDAHSRSVSKNDNGGKDYLDRLEHSATMKDRKIASMGRVIDDLKSKLSTDKP